MSRGPAGRTSSVLRPRRHHDRCRSAGATVQPLERRALLSMTVDGTVGNDQINVYVVGPLVTVTVNGVPTSELDAIVAEIVINGAGGNDTVRIGRNTDNAISIFGGDGDDLILVSDSSGLLSSLGGPDLNIAISGDAGDDRVVLNDSARLEAAVHSVVPVATNAARVSVTDGASSPLAPTINLAAIEHLQVRAGGGDDVLRVVEDVPRVDIALDGGEGDDSFEILGDGGSDEFPVVLSGGGGLDDFSVFAGGVEAALAGAQEADFIRVDAGSRLRLAPAAGGSDETVTTRALTLFGTGTLDLDRGTLLLDYAGPSPAASVRQRLGTGYNLGTWTGTGITSSAAAATPHGAVGMAEATELFAAFPAVFAGVPIDGSTLILRYTISGDADLSRHVDIADFARLATNFNRAASWAGGDFDFDDVAGISDFSLLAGNFNKSAATAVAGSRGAPGGASRGVWERIGAAVDGV